MLRTIKQSYEDQLGTYEYCLVVDGRWMPDPLARATVPNPFGGRNSVLKAACSAGAAHLADAENLPLENANTYC